MSEDAGPEELLESRPRSLVRWHWLALAMIVALTVAVLVVGGVTLARGGDDAPRAVAVSTLASAAPGRPTAAPTSAVLSTVPRPVCLDVGDSALNCGVTADLPRATVVATQLVLPTAAAVTATTVTGRDGRVYSRRVLVRSDNGSTLQLRISPDLGQGGTTDTTGADDGKTVRYGEDVGRRRVEVVVRVQPGSTVPTITTLQRLVRDPRLFAVA